jgi:hypothetical protein
MATGTINSNVDPMKWKQLFEAALDELSGDAQPDRNRPIYQRKTVASDTEPEYKRTDRALSNAADALAALWKMSPSKSVLRSSTDRNPK